MLRSLKVTAYKLFREVHFQFGPLTVVVGANGAGKTALWEVLALCPTLLRNGGSDDALDALFRDLSGLGFAGIKHWGIPSSGPVITLNVDDFEYTVAFEGVGIPGLEHADTRAEQLLYKNAEILRLTGMQEGSKRYSIRGDPNPLAGDPPPPSFTHRLRGPLVLNPSTSIGLEAEWFRLELRNFQGLRNYNPRAIANDLSDLRVDAAGEELQWDGRNLAQVLLKLKVEDDERFGEIRDILQAAIGEQSLRLQISMGGQLIQVTLQDSAGHRLWLQDWPDGWKAFLLLTVALRTASPKGLVFIEEPEGHLHPRMIDAFYDQVCLANERGTQVIVATHSMELINHLEDARQLLLLDHGRPRTPSGDVAEAILESGVLLGTALRAGALDEPLPS